MYERVFTVWVIVTLTITIIVGLTITIIVGLTITIIVGLTITPTGGTDQHFFGNVNIFFSTIKRSF